LRDPQAQTLENSNVDRLLIYGLSHRDLSGCHKIFGDETFNQQQELQRETE